jgi:hypothetical protein
MVVLVLCDVAVNSSAADMTTTLLYHYSPLLAVVLSTANDSLLSRGYNLCSRYAVGMQGTPAVMPNDDIMLHDMVPNLHCCVSRRG